jgi:acid phosphatase (class A)
MNTRSRIILTLTFFAFVSAPLRAEELPYLSPNQFDPIAVLPPPPEPGSPEQAADLASVVAVHKACSPSEFAVAKSQDRYNFFIFASAIGPFFQRGKLPLTEALLHRVGKETDEIQGTVKSYWKRLRPYEVDLSLADGLKPENTFSYPSAHSTSATVFALLLADLFPEKQNEILALGRNIGWHRVELAKHYPTDVYAGRVLASAIVRELKASPAFQKDFAAAKAEAATAIQQHP